MVAFSVSKQVHIWWDYLLLLRVVVIKVDTKRWISYDQFLNIIINFNNQQSKRYFDSKKKRKEEEEEDATLFSARISR